jgi:hypothetical protein
MALTVILSSVGNPDFGQDTRRPVNGANKRRVKVQDFRQASMACLAFIADHDLGGGNWNGGLVTDATGREVGNVSYNGCVWEPGGFKINAEPLYRPASADAKADRKDPIKAAVVDVPGFGEVSVTGGWQLNIVDGTQRIGGSFCSVSGRFLVGGKRHEFAESVIFEDFGDAHILRERLSIHPDGAMDQTTPVSDQLWTALSSAITEYFASPEGVVLTLENAMVDRSRMVALHRSSIADRRAQIDRFVDAIAAEQKFIDHLQSRLAEFAAAPSPTR